MADLVWIVIGLVLAFFGLIFGILVGKYLSDRVKWGDKKKIIDGEWKLKLEQLDKTYQQQILELQKNNQLCTEKLVNSWETRYTNDLVEIKELIQSAEKYMRQDAITRSKRTLLGRLWEQVSPYLPNFPFRPSDMKFLGSPIDFVIFDGASENDIKQVIFMEVKSGDSNLSTQERRLRDAINEGKVSWQLFNIDKPEEIKIQEEEEKAEIEGEIAPHELYEKIDNKLASVKKENTEEPEKQEDNQQSILT